MNRLREGFPRRLGWVLLVLASSAWGEDAKEPHPLSLALRTIERDLESGDYRDVLATMIPTDLAAEWQRVATPDNYLRFAAENGGLETVLKDAALKAAYDRRKSIAERFLAMMRGAYEQKKQKPPFDEGDALIKTLESADRKGTGKREPRLPIEPILAAAGAERQWPGFRGPTGQGQVHAAGIPLKWSDTQNVVWKVALPGRGNSSPVIWDERLFITAESSKDADSKTPRERLLLCFDRNTGQKLWEHAAPAAKENETLYWKNTYASSTPVTDGERVIAFFGNAGLVCCDLDGNRRWHADLGPFPITHGPGTTPVLYKDLVIVIQDANRGESVFAAVDKQTGQVRWRKGRPQNMGWATPLLLRIGQRDELIFNGSNQVVSYNPQTGDELWTLSGSSAEAVPMVVAGGGLLFSVSGRNGPIIAIRTGGEGDVTASNVAWRNERGGPHVPSPAFHDGRLYVLGDTGVFTCLDAETGETLWQQRLRGRFSMSPLVIGDMLLVTSEDGATTLIKSAARFERLAENPLNETTLATPAVLDGRIWFRTAEHLWCIGEAR